MEKIPVILDTDIGSDIDDAVALAYLMRQPACDLLGITTVSGEPQRRASLASAICRAAGRGDIPIHVGMEDPWVINQHQPKAPQYDALGDKRSHAEYDRRCTAIEYLRDTIRSRPGEITLLAIGPLTNIGTLFAIDPEIPGMLRQVMLMGGRFVTRPQGYLTEWNILCDPHAAAKVFSTPLPRLTAVGLDVTEQCRMAADTCRERFQKAGGPLEVVADMAEVWFRHTNQITFHDPLAAALIFEPELCELQKAHIQVDIDSRLAPGNTVQVFDENQPHDICSGVDAQRFFNHYFATVGG